MKTIEEILSETAKSLGYHNFKDVCNISSPYHMSIYIMKCMEQYAKQRCNEPEWIEIKSENDLPKEESQYFVYSKVDYHPGYRIDIFSGRLSNAIHHMTGKPIFSHYQKIVKPNTPNVVTTK